MGWPDGPVGRGLNGLARPDIRPTDRAWAVRQARWTVQARPGGPAGQKGPSPIGPCLARARAVPCRAGPLLIFNRMVPDTAPAPARAPSFSYLRTRLGAEIFWFWLL